MIKIVFLFLLFFSQTSFSAYPVYPPIGVSADALIGKDFSFKSYSFSPFWYSSILTGGYSYPLDFGGVYDTFGLIAIGLPVSHDKSSFFHIVGWTTVTKTITAAGFSENNGYEYSISFSSPSLSFCPGITPDGTPPFAIANIMLSDVSSGCCHPQCVSDFPKYTFEMCAGTVASETIIEAFLLACVSSPEYASQQTVITKNKLVSESNSKLGVIASSEATNTGLLSDILSSLREILANSQSSLNSFFNSTSNSNPELSSDLMNVSAIAPAISSNASSCPSSKNFSLMGRNFSISYQPLCDFAVRLRLIVIPAARVAAAWIVIGAL